MASHFFCCTIDLVVYSLCVHLWKNAVKDELLINISLHFHYMLINILLRYWKKYKMKNIKFQFQGSKLSLLPISRM